MALGKTSLKKTDNIDALLGRSAEPKKVSTATKAAKLTSEEVEQIDLIKKMLVTDNTSEAIRWCIKAAWIVHGDEIQEIVKKREAIKPIIL
jgi:rubrerythrin